MSDRVRVEPVAGVLRVRFAGDVLAETSGAFVVYETGLPPRYYVPRDAVRGELADGQGAGTCPWKGRWRHLDLRAADKTVSNAAWTYFETTPVCERVKDFIAFYPEKVEAIETPPTS